MNFVDLQDEIDRLMRAGNPEKAGEIAGFLQAFPDAVGVFSRWGDLRICSVAANLSSDHVELQHQSLEHDRAPLEVWVYAVVGKNDRLYANPPCFVVADANTAGFGEIPRPDWRQQMVDAGIARPIIEKVAQYLERHPPVSYSDAE